MNWQLREINQVHVSFIIFYSWAAGVIASAQVQANNQHLTSVAAYRLYFLCQIMDAPNEMPTSKEETQTLFENAVYCSCWKAVLALANIGAFRRPARLAA